MDYKTTLNLPQTSFPMKANLANREPTTLKRWQDIGLYQKFVINLQVDRSLSYTMGRRMQTAPFILAMRLIKY